MKTVLVILAFALLSGLNPIQGQVSTPEVFDTASLQEQLDYLEQRTNIYNGYRAVRDDIFLKMKANTLDSLSSVKKEITRLESLLGKTISDMDSLEIKLQQTNDDLQLAIKNKNSFSFIGIQMHKTLYNSIMWIIVLALAALLIILLLAFRRNFAVTSQTRKDLEETREEFEAHRQQSRERYEKLVVQHHKEIQKLKGKRPL